MPQLGRYEILQRLARGKIADVLLARASGLEGFARHVVIKQIRPEHLVDQRFVEAFLAEARIGASLNHQNIVQVFDIDQVGGIPYFAMEYVHGEDVRRLLRKVVAMGKAVPLEIVVAIGAAAAAGLHHAHEQHGPDRKPLDLVHRDVSPSNILIGFDGSVKLVDFGLAKPALRSSKTRTGALGKAPYMSPELCMGKSVDRRSDLFALGTVLYELATARRLFKGDTDFHTMQMIVESKVPPPSTLRPDLPRAFDEIVMRALAKDPAARYQTAYDLRNALEGLAIDNELRTTAKAIADYLVSLFGERPEPWHVPVSEHEGEAQAGDDFEAVHGLVPTPQHGMKVITEGSPIALARDVAAGHTPDPDFDENPTRLDLPPGDEATVLSRRDQTPSKVDTITSLGDSTTTAQPIVDVLSGVQPALARRTASTMTVREEDVKLNDTNTATLDDAFLADDSATIDQRTVAQRPSAMKSHDEPETIDQRSPPERRSAPPERRSPLPAPARPNTASPYGAPPADRRSPPPQPFDRRSPSSAPPFGSVLSSPQQPPPFGTQQPPPFGGASSQPQPPFGGASSSPQPPFGSAPPDRRSPQPSSPPAFGSERRPAPSSLPPFEPARPGNPPFAPAAASPAFGAAAPQVLGVPGPHGAIVPPPQPPRADSDAGDEATTVEPPLFPIAEPAIHGVAPEAVYIPLPPAPRPLAQRWAIVIAILVVPIAIGIAGHSCGASRPGVHGGP